MSDYISYFSEALYKGKISRWDDHLMPIKVYITPLNWYQGNRPAKQYYSMVEKALEEWSAATEGALRFKIVDSSSSSQIRIYWIRVVKKALGWCYYKEAVSGKLVAANLEIGLTDGILHPGYDSDINIYHTILHELGHAIGLRGHTEPREDIMTKNTTYGKYYTLSKRDKVTAKWLYRFPNEIKEKEILVYYGKDNNFTLDDLILELENKPKTENNQSNSITRINNTDFLHQYNLISELNKINLSQNKINTTYSIKELSKNLLVEHLQHQKNYYALLENLNY